MKNNMFTNKEFILSVMESSYDGIYITDKNSITIYVNSAYEKLTGHNRSEYIGRSMSELINSGIMKVHITDDVIKSKKPITVTEKLISGKNVLITGNPVFDDTGEVIAVITNVRDISKIISLEKEEKLSKEIISHYRHQYFDPSTINNIICESPGTISVFNFAAKVAPRDSTVLLTGETGVGKEIVAKYIHYNSLRKNSNYIKINCGAIPENLLESELFGYVGGAFTGADPKGKPGMFEMANGGTLFLDEISELPLMLQVKILHFLQTKKMMRVGGTKEIMIDTRVIAASNKNLEGEVERGNFRSDLYYRINVIPIYIPPLRDRKRDLMAMAEYFLDFYNAKYRKNVILTEEMAEYVMAHKWPGNVRELENYMERMVVTSVPETTENGEKEGREPHEKMLVVAGYGEKLSDMIEKAEKEAVVEAYRKYKSSYKVAEILGISQSTAYRRIKKFVKDKDE